MKQIKVEWCENFIKAVFRKHDIPAGGGIEIGCFWRLAEESGLYKRGTYGGPMSVALENVCKVEIVHDTDGNFLYHIFKLA